LSEYGKDYNSKYSIKILDMKIYNYIFVLLLILLIFSCGSDDDSFDAPQVQILLDQGETPFALYNEGIPIDSLYGKFYQEGIIFHFEPDNGTGLILSLNDLDTKVKWGCRGNDINGLGNVNYFPSNMTGKETEEGALIGDGNSNTNIILDNCNEENIAASICKNLGPEWFLPSRGEFRLISINLFKKGIEGLLPNNMYWTSTEYDKDNAWRINFGWGGSTSFKDQKSYVRAIKAF
jgi:hypothetical protein